MQSVTRAIVFAVRWWQAWSQSGPIDARRSFTHAEDTAAKRFAADGATAESVAQSGSSALR